jgi:hypothetical protein
VAFLGVKQGVATTYLAHAQQFVGLLKGNPTNQTSIEAQAVQKSNHSISTQVKNWMSTSDLKLFCQANRAWVQSLIDTRKIQDEVKGVHFAFVHRYSKPGHGLDGQLCLITGQERGGQYFEKFNFFGGKVEHTDGRCPASRILGASFRELWEEMGVRLTVPLESVVIDVIMAGRSLIWVCAIDGISTSSINKAIANKDKDPSLPGCYKEIQECRQITRDDLHKCSSYVQAHFHSITAAYRAGRMHFKEAMRPVYCKKHS